MPTVIRIMNNCDIQKWPQHLTSIFQAVGNEIEQYKEKLSRSKGKVEMSQKFSNFYGTTI